MTGKMRVLCGGKEVIGTAEIVMVTDRDALLRGLKTFAMVAVAALCTIIIPGVHFLSVPLGLISSPIIGVTVYFKSRGVVKGMSGDFVCPFCSHQNLLEYQEGKAPFYGSCVSCKNPYQAFPILRTN